MLEFKFVFYRICITPAFREVQVKPYRFPWSGLIAKENSTFYEHDTIKFYKF